MTSRYKHPFTGESISRQRFHQIQAVKNGFCQHHHTRPKSPDSLNLCEECIAKWRNYKPGVRRHHPVEVWRSIDWSRKVSDIAKELGVTTDTVYKKRYEFGDVESKRYEWRKGKGQPTKLEMAILRECPFLSTRQTRIKLGLSKGSFWRKCQNLEAMRLIRVKPNVRIKGYPMASAVGLTEKGKDLLASYDSSIQAATLSAVA